MRELRELCKALEAYKLQQTQIKCQLESASSLQVIKSWRSMLKYISKEMNLLEEKIDNLCDDDAELRQHYNNLQTIPGIGKTTAIALLSYIPDLTYFKNARQLAAYAGLVPKHRISGTSIRGKSRLSKQGSSRLRRALFFPAIVASRCNPILLAFCNNLNRAKKAKMTIIGAVMRKMLHIVFGIIKHRTAFNPLHLSTN